MAAPAPATPASNSRPTTGDGCTRSATPSAASTPPATASNAFTSTLRWRARAEPGSRGRPATDREVTANHRGRRCQRPILPALSTDSEKRSDLGAKLVVLHRRRHRHDAPALAERDLPAREDVADD